MLINSFFTIESIETVSENEIITSISIKPDHIIFQGHFPGNPVVPGVVSIQMINEILSEHTGENLILSKAGIIKFPLMINPEHNTDLFVKINFWENDEKGYKVNALIYFEDLIFFKMRGGIHNKILKG